MVEDNNAAKDAASKAEGAVSKQADKLPKMSAENKKMAGNFMPWWAGVLGLLALVWANDLRDAASGVGAVDDALGSFGDFLSAALPSSGELWVGAALMAAVAVLIIMAFVKGLFNKSKAGYQFATYAMLAAVVSGLYYVFMLSELSSGRGWLALVAGAVGYYGLHQTKDLYNN